MTDDGQALPLPDLHRLVPATEEVDLLEEAAAADDLPDDEPADPPAAEEPEEDDLRLSDGQVLGMLTHLLGARPVEADPEDDAPAG